MKGEARRYHRFRHAPFYGPKGIVTADSLGCPFLCAYCWGFSKNENPAQGEFFKPAEVVAKLQAISHKKGCDQFRISGSEPILGLESARHIAKVIKALPGEWVVETNGFIAGVQPELLDLFEGLDIFWRLTLKGSNPITFERVTGAEGSNYRYPLRAVEAIRAKGFRLQVAFNPKFVTRQLIKIPFGVDIELETLHNYAGVPARMKARGLI